MNDFLLTEAELRTRGGGKWRKYPTDVLPAYVADMDFKVAPAVQGALKRFIDRQDYVYELQGDIDGLFNAFASWMEHRHGWSPDPALTIALADVVQGIFATITGYSAPGDGVIVQTPVYPPFLRMVANSGRRLVENPLLRLPRERYAIDFDGLEKAAADARILLFCNPHNPTGRVFERAELQRIAEIAARHDLTIISDEIHADLIYRGAAHSPMEAIAGAAERTVTLTSATKGFNIPGTRTAVLHLGSEGLKSQFEAAVPQSLLGRPSRFGIDATIAAWTESEPWLEEVLAYLDANREMVTRWAAARPEIEYRAPEATFLAWLDFSAMRLPASPYEFFLEAAKVGLSDGADFGGLGLRHVRLNFATTAEILEEILRRMSRALDES
jgi:cystathionine beta-lyase